MIAADPAVTVHLRSTAPARLFPRAPGRVFVDPLETDVGMVQPHGLGLDLDATLARLDDFESSSGARLESETRWLESIGAALVVGDIPPLAFAAADAASIPSFALGNFSWDWIYASYTDDHRRFAEHAENARARYRQAERLLRLPFHGDMSAFRAVTDVPLIAHRVAESRIEARRMLGLPEDRPLVLLSFGGFGFPGLAVDRLGVASEIE
ncbi:MAG: hypothetical protein ACREQQ_02420, partial [Candidatus Binatia bacterium]